MNISEAIAKRILHLCETQNISINKLASLSQITQSTINSIVSGESKNPKLKTVFKICCGFNITLKDFFDSPYFDDLK